MKFSYANYSAYLYPLIFPWSPKEQLCFSIFRIFRRKEKKFLRRIFNLFYHGALEIFYVFYTPSFTMLPVTKQRNTRKIENVYLSVDFDGTKDFSLFSNLKLSIGSQRSFSRILNNFHVFHISEQRNSW